MDGINLVTAISTVRDLGIAGLMILLFWMWWTERKDQQKREKADRDAFSSQLKNIIKEEMDSKTAIAIALTKLSESINNFQKNCVEIQRQLQDEVNRMKVKNDG